MSIREKANAVLKNQSLGVLGTSYDDMPHTTLVAFTANVKRKEAFFVTSISSRKAQNIEKNPYVSLFIDNRKNKVIDFMETLGITIKGKVARESDTSTFVSKHPHLLDFVHAPSTALYRISITSVEVVTNFQKVYELKIDA